jgi:hypothetical protein
MQHSVDQQPTMDIFTVTIRCVLIPNNMMQNTGVKNVDADLYRFIFA